MNTDSTGPLYSVEYASVRELTDHAESASSKVRAYLNKPEKTFRDFYGVPNNAAAFKLAREGWAEEVQRALEAADSAVEKVERTFEQLSFVATHDVSGADVDIDRFLSGEPECMIDYPLTPIVKAGRVITICVSVGYSGVIKPETVVKRGHAIAALVLALSRLGYATEIWSDWSVTSEHKATEPEARFRTLLKGPQDALDTEELVYAVAHPSYKRVLHFAALDHLPGPLRSSFIRPDGTLKGCYSLPAIEDLPEGTVYTANLRAGSDVPDADEQLVEWLKQLGIVTD